MGVRAGICLSVWDGGLQTAVRAGEAGDQAGLRLSNHIRTPGAFNVPYPLPDLLCLQGGNSPSPLTSPCPTDTQKRCPLPSRAPSPASTGKS